MLNHNINNIKNQTTIILYREINFEILKINKKENRFKFEIIHFIVRALLFKIRECWVAMHNINRWLCSFYSDLFTQIYLYICTKYSKKSFCEFWWLNLHKTLLSLLLLYSKYKLNPIKTYKYINWVFPFHVY